MEEVQNDDVEAVHWVIGTKMVWKLLVYLSPLETLYFRLLSKEVARTVTPYVEEEFLWSVGLFLVNTTIEERLGIPTYFLKRKRIRRVYFNLAKQFYSFDSEFCETLLTALPEHLLVLRIGKYFDLSIDHLPSGLAHLSFDSDGRFNRPIDRLPPSLISLSLGKHFNQNVDRLPQGLLHLSLGDGFARSIENLPLGLLSLRLGVGYYAEREGSIELPKTLASIRLMPFFPFLVEQPATPPVPYRCHPRFFRGSEGSLSLPFLRSVEDENEEEKREISSLSQHERVVLRIALDGRREIEMEVPILCLCKRPSRRQPRSKQRRLNRRMSFWCE